MVISPVGVLVVPVVVIVRAVCIPVSVTDVGVMSAAFPSVGNGNADVEWLGL